VRKLEKSRSFVPKTQALDNESKSELLEEQSQEYNSKYYEHVSTANVDFPEKTKTLAKSLEILNKGLKFSPKDRNLLLTRSYIYYYMH
jgi:hypothetical protein